VGQARKRKPLEEQESARWREGSQLACEGQQRGPETLVVHVADGEGDLHEWCLEALRRVPGDRAEFSIRAKGPRRLAKETAPRYLWEDMPQARAAGHLTRDLPRPVTLSVAVKRVTFTGAHRPGGRLPPGEVVAV
jgi:hypothetical protein